MSGFTGQLTQTLGTSRIIDNSGESWADGSWFLQLQPGSWRGCGFVLDAGDTVAGRRVAIHEYPYRDDAWAEDLGKLPRRFSIQAFMVGDDVYQQRDAMIAACEQAGPGTLIHPTLGSIQCVLMEFQVTDRRERGRVVEVQFSFIIAGDVQYPATVIATGQNVLAQAGLLNAASAADLGSALAGVGPVTRTAASGVSQFTGMATGAVDDAARIFGCVRGLQGFYGRYATGNRQAMQPATATVHSVLSDATRSRTAVYAAADLVNLTASLL
jgi:prophage DNA circulation protein